MKRTTRKLRYMSAAIAMSALTAFALTGTAFADAETAVTFNDATLEATLLALPGVDANGDGVLSEGELNAMTGGLVLHDLGITDVTGMQYLIGIDWMDLSGNGIRDITPLAALDLDTLDITRNYLDIAEGSADRIAIAALEAADCEVSWDPQSEVPADGISLDAESAELCAGDTRTLTASVSPSDAANQAVSWASDNEGVATVTDGTVTAAGVGTAHITATAEDGGFTAVYTVTVKPDKLASSIYTIKSGYVTGVAEFTVANVLTSNFTNASTDIRVCTAAGAAYPSGRVGTGMRVQLWVGGTQRDDLRIVVGGDVDGTGEIDIMDYTYTRLHILDIQRLSGAFSSAADVNGDGTVDILDYTGIRLNILDLSPITDTLPDLPEVSDPRIRAFLDIALAQQGKPYIWGDEGANGFDCSGFIYYCLNQSGYRVGRTTADTYSRRSSWAYVDRDELQPGDLMFYYSDTPDDGDHIGHIGIYLGNGYHIHASSDYGYVVICRVEGWYDRMLSHGRRVFQ